MDFGESQRKGIPLERNEFGIMPGSFFCLERVPFCSCRLFFIVYRKQ